MRASEDAVLPATQRRAALVPVGRLALLPLCAAGERMVWNRLPSARLLPAVFKRPADSPASWRRLVVAVPGDDDDSLSGVVGEARSLAEQAEARGLEDHTVLLRHDATLAALQRHLPRTELLHFAGHGRFDALRPLRSSLFLADRERLTLRHILDRELDLSQLRLVVLSACETGLAEYEYRADEALGFSAALLQAGVPSVVGSLWQVDDAAATLLMTRFHAALSTGSSAATALRDARIWLRDSTAEALGLEALYEDRLERSTTPGQREAARRHLADVRANPGSRPFRAPYHWAPFTVSGVG